MGIQTKTITTANCDLCQEDIDTSEPYVDAMSYGASFHTRCVTSTDYSPLDVMKALGLDDIHRITSRDSREKLIYNVTS